MIKRVTTPEELESSQLIAMGAMFYAPGILPGSFVPDIFIRNWTKILAADMGAMWIAELNGQVAGALGALIHPDINDGVLVAQEAFWFMSPAARGGITALRLYHEFERWAVQRGAGRLGMACICNEHMGALRALYTRLGYRPVDVSYFKNI